MGEITKKNLAVVFKGRSVGRADQIPAMDAVSAEAHWFSLVVLDNTKDCADRQQALRFIRQAVLVAHASIEIEGAL